MKRDEVFYITTPIYYVNDKPHIGHAYTTILADVLARFHRLMGGPTFFLTGTDEHGLKVQQAAARAGISPQEQADRTVTRFQELWQRLEITCDDFIRTTEPRHKEIVQEMLQDLYDRGEIYRDEYDGWYDVSSETFVTERDLNLEPGQSPESLPHITRIREANYFFRMSRYQDWLIQYIQDHPQFIQPDFRRNETLGFLRKPLNDLCISRPKSRLGWGIELPFDRDFVCYVWFDALVNYISAMGYRRDEKAFRKWWPASYHLIGKDILTTHSVYWPIMLKASGVPLPECVFAHGWWLSGQTKMSKSLGNVVNPMEMIDRYGVDPFRYYLMADMVLGQDASFTEEAFIRRFNADLANDLGNLVSRVFKMLMSYREGRIPSDGSPPGPETAEADMWARVQNAVESVESGIPSMKVDAAISSVMDGVRAVNRYLEGKQPWTLAKKGPRDELDRTLYTAAEALRVISALLHPIMPAKMSQLRRALGLPEGDPDIRSLRAWGGLKPGSQVVPPASLFPRIRKEESNPVEALPSPETPSPGVPLLAYEDFSRIQLRTAVVRSAACIKNADKLLQLDIDIGGERRTLVAGIAASYPPDTLVGRTIIVVANLAPARIRGVESQGMLLAATAQNGQPRLLCVDGDVPAGTVVK